MITTNEPGIYLENKYGIRIENEMLCVEKGSSEFGDFLGFETITVAPIDLDGIRYKLNLKTGEISTYTKSEILNSMGCSLRRTKILLDMFLRLCWFVYVYMYLCMAN